MCVSMCIPLDKSCVLSPFVELEISLELSWPGYEESGQRSKQKQKHTKPSYNKKYSQILGYNTPQHFSAQESHILTTFKMIEG